MATTFQLLRAGNGKIIRSASGRPFGNNVSVAATTFPNSSRRRMPYAVSRDLQPAVVAGKELYFRVTHADLRTVANGGLSQTGFDFQFETTAGVVVPYVVKSYDAVAGTLFGVFKNDLAGSAAATRGYLYFNNPAWTATRENPVNTFVSGNTCLFLPSGINHSGVSTDMSGDLPTSDKVLVNPGALLNGSTDYIWRPFSGTPVNTFLVSIYAQDKDANSDNAMWAFGLEGVNTVVFIRRLFGTATGPTGGETNAWRFGWVTTEPGASVTSACYYETANDTSGTNLQHVVIRRFTDGTDPEIYLDGVLSPLVFRSTPLTANAALRGPIATTGQRLLVGRGSGATRFWHGYLDCFKFYSGSNKTATWAKSEYDNLLDIDGAVIFGDPETVATATMFGETIDITCNGLSNVTFAADKYVTNDAPVAGTPPATPSIQSLTQPAGGTLAVTTGNNVNYSNTSNTDPDDGGVVVMTNGSGTVKVPIRATVVHVAPPPPAGYYKTPNIAGKTPVDAGSLGNASTPGTLLWAIAQFANGTFSTATRYIRITGQIDTGVTNGRDINVNAGGSQTHPLVIMSDAPAGPNNWTSRSGKKVINCALVLQRPWTWVYGLWMQMLPFGVAQWHTTGAHVCVLVQADNTFQTANRMSAATGVYTDSTTLPTSGLTINFNWFEICMQSQTANTTPADYCFACSDSATDCVQALTFAYNYINDYVPAIAESLDFRIILAGNGHKGAGRIFSAGSDVAWNFCEASVSHTFEFKFSIPKLHHNHSVGIGSQGGSVAYNAAGTRGENVDGPTTGTRPIMFANRIKSTHWFIEGRNWDYVSNYHVDASNTPFGTMALIPNAVRTVGGKGIGGADGCNFVDHKGNMILGDVSFEPPNYTYNSLGATGKVLLAGTRFGTVKDGAGTACAFNSYPPGPGTMTGTHPSIIESAITRRDSTLAYALEVPPILTVNLTGPTAAGKTWP